jgi:hypothetical protein
MNFLKSIAGSGVAVMLTFTAPVAWGQSVSKNVGGSVAVVDASGAGRGHDSIALMDQNVSREIKQAWSEGKNATAAMAFQENGEIAMDEGKEKEATQYFQAAERELGTLQPEGQ